MTEIEKALQIAQTADVSTRENGAVLYSISYLKSDENKRKAIDYVQKYEKCLLLDDTECGRQIIDLNLDNDYKNPKDEIQKIWHIASKRFILAASGNLTAFVDNADPRSTFVSVELPLILQNERIKTINYIDKKEFAKQFLD